MTLRHKLFSFHGRIRRRDWWLLNIGAAAAFVLFLAVLTVLFKGSTGVVGALDDLLALGSVLALNWISFALSAKRMHDRQRTAWWLAVPLVLDLVLAGLLVYGVLRFANAAQNQGGLVAALQQFGTAEGLLTLLLAIVGVWLLIDLGILDGTPGPNRYGPSPKDANPAVAA